MLIPKFGEAQLKSNSGVRQTTIMDEVARQWQPALITQFYPELCQTNYDLTKNFSCIGIPSNTFKLGRIELTRATTDS